MRTKTKLITALRTFFGVFRVLAVITIAAAPLGLLLPWTTAHGKASLRFGSGTLVRSTAEFANAGGTINVIGLVGDIVARAPSTHQQLRAIEYRVSVPLQLVLGIVCLVVSDPMWRLLRNAEAGEIFVPANVSLMRRLGWTTLAGGALWEVASGWATDQFGAFIVQHATIEGLTLAPLSGYWSIHLNEFLFGWVVEGALVLALAEVFRHGLALKQEAELTI